MVKLIVSSEAWRPKIFLEMTMHQMVQGLVASSVATINQTMSAISEINSHNGFDEADNQVGRSA